TVSAKAEKAGMAKANESKNHFVLIKQTLPEPSHLCNNRSYRSACPADLKPGSAGILPAWFSSRFCPFSPAGCRRSQVLGQALTKKGHGAGKHRVLHTT